MEFLLLLDNIGRSSVIEDPDIVARQRFPGVVVVREGQPAVLHCYSVLVNNNYTKRSIVVG